MTKEELDVAIGAIEGSISWLESLVIPFAWLVAIGVAGEAFIQVKQLLNNRELKALRTQEAQFISKERATLQTEVSKAQKDAADAQKAAADSQLALEKFKAPRTLNPEQLARIESKIKQFSGQQFALSISSDNESYQLMKFVRRAVEAAGWIWTEPFGMVRNSDGSASISLETGVKIQIAPSRDRSPVNISAGTLAAVLSMEGIEAKLEVYAGLEVRANTIQIIIGSKPR